MPEQQGTHIGKYRIIELVGEGAMGSVYRALDPVLNRTVAIKVMNAGIARNDELRGRFLREAQSAGSLQHPNVVTVYDFGEVDGHLFIAMEFVAGVDLETLLARHEPLPLLDKLDIMIDVLAGLAYAHQHGIVHRDIKPANIRVTEQPRAKIMDFGVAHLDSSDMTRTGVMMGTPNYMAPEQVTGSQVTAASDLFAVGAVLYELLTNTKPFVADTIHQVLYKIVTETPPPVTLVLPGLPSKLDAIVSRALQKDPDDRYQSALEMANDLTEVRSTLSGGVSKSVSLGATLSSRLSDPARRAIEEAAAAAAPAVTTPAASSVARRSAIIGGSVIFAAAAIILAWTIGARGSTGAAPAASAGLPTDSSAVGAAPANTSTGVPASPIASPAVSPAATAESTRTAASRSAASEMVRTLRATAGRARGRAVSAGATRAQLAAGDRELAASVRAFDRGATELATELANDATTSFLLAERLARTAGSAGEASAVTSGTAASRAQSQDSVRVAPPTVRTVPSTESPPPSVAPPRITAAPVRSAESEIRAVVAEYARAIESRDIGMIRAIYPNLSATQQRGFEQFFASVRALRAELAVDAVEVNGDVADARISGAYDYTTSAGQAEQPVSFRATLRLVGGVWKLFAVR